MSGVLLVVATDDIILHRVVEILDRCDFEPDDPTEPSGSCKCSRCGRRLDEALSPPHFMSCDKGRSQLIGYSFWCPGCDQIHIFHVNTPSDRPDQPLWTFNGKMKSPTFAPSLMLVARKDRHQCHLHLVDGVICYCDDCTHPYKGMKVPLRPCPW